MCSDRVLRYNAPWHDLREVCVGSTYGPDFYEPIRDSAVRDALQRIASETQEDYDGMIQVLTALGVSVWQVPTDPHVTVMDFVDDQGRIDYGRSQSFTLIPKPPMQPRDSVLVVGEQAVLTNRDGGWFGQVRPEHRAITCEQEFDAPLVTVVGDRLIADCRDHAWLAHWLGDIFPDRQVVPVHIGGHNDAVFSVLAPGVIVSTYHHTNYHDTFPGWSVKYIENQSWNAIPEWRRFKHSNRARWWVPDGVHNHDFERFVDTWLDHWMGYVAETVFDVNMLQIDQHRVLVNNHNRDLFQFLAQHGIEPIIVPFRHRFFWDGGLHCITNDLWREGPNECYF